MGLNITTETTGDVTSVRLEGNLDTETANAALDALTATIDGGASRLVIDFHSVDFVSSAGLRVLLSTAKRLSGTGGKLRIGGLNATITEIFEISGFNTILEVFPTAEDARAGF